MSKKITASQFKTIIKEEVIKLHKKTLLENERENLIKEQNKLFEKQIYGNSEEEDSFLRKVKSENPEMISRFMSILKNRGLEAAKEKYLEFDLEHIQKLKTDNERIVSNKKLIDIFVRSLPKDLKAEVDDFSAKTNEGIDSAFHYIIGKWINIFEGKYGEKKAFDLERVLSPTSEEDILSDEYLDYDTYFLDKIDKKYGEGVFEW